MGVKSMDWLVGVSEDKNFVGLTFFPIYQNLSLSVGGQFLGVC